MLLLLIASWCAGGCALVVVPTRAPATLAVRRSAVSLSYGRPTDEGRDSLFDLSQQQFDLLSLRTFRRDTILQYDATNQSEPLRIALTLIGVLFSLSVPTLTNELRIGDELTGNIGALCGTGISGSLFVRNREARTARMAKIDKEYALGDLRATYRGVRTTFLRELRQKPRCGSHRQPRSD